MKKLPELLAPAGTPACALAAFDAGADAVYAGLFRFNARERGENFTPESLAGIVDYAHKLDRKVYVTFNTLLKENELPEAVETLGEINRIAPDALLVQDLGVLRIIREYFPRLAIHASTQMGFHNSAGLRFASRLGVSRVVLERQVTLEELESMTKDSPVELEVFVHGALCCSLSGSCLFSSYLGGYSGNRGKCKQPCRRRYFSTSGNGFFFSPQDLCALELVPEFTRLGVASLKIEGRLRQADYVAAAVGAYRLMLDAPEDEFRTRLGEARKMLSGVAGRKWSHGFYSPASASGLIRSNAVGAAGIRCGSIEAVRGNGFGFTASKRLFIGDRIRVQPDNGDEGPALTLTKFFVNDRPATRVLSGERVFVCCDKKIPDRGGVFKLGGQIPDYTARLAALPPHRAPLDLKLAVGASRITVETLNAPLERWEKTVAFAPAAKHPLDAEQLRAMFTASGSSDFALGKFTAELEGALFCPASVLKELRREFWDYAAGNLSPSMVDDGSGTALDAFRRDYLALKPGYELPERRIETVAMKPHGAEPADRRAIRADGIFDFNALTSEAILPDFFPEPKLDSLRKAILSALKSGIRRFRVTSLYGLELLRGMGEDIRICVSAPLPVCNSFAALELSRFGVAQAMAHVELERASVEALREKSPLPVELYRLGRPALLTTRAKIPFEGELRDARGAEFVVRFDRRSGLTRLYPKKVHSVPRLEGVWDFYDLTNANWRAAETGTFNFEGEWY